METVPGSHVESCPIGETADVSLAIIISPVLMRRVWPSAGVLTIPPPERNTTHLQGGRYVNECSTSIFERAY